MAFRFLNNILGFASTTSDFQVLKALRSGTRILIPGFPDYAISAIKVDLRAYLTFTHQIAGF